MSQLESLGVQHTLAIVLSIGEGRELIGLCVGTGNDLVPATDLIN
jgi:hypothetical protein